jgi:hypothetical protein
MMCASKKTMKTKEVNLLTKRVRPSESARAFVVAISYATFHEWDRVMVMFCHYFIFYGSDGRIQGKAK